MLGSSLATVSALYPFGAARAEASPLGALADNVAGAPLNGQNRYRVRFPAGQTPPVDAFWSLTLTGPTLALVDNPINRYAIHDRTEGLQTAPDGSLEIQIQHDQPAAGSSNWLPAPKGKFLLMMRLYWPNETAPSIIDGSWSPPAAKRAS